MSTLVRRLGVDSAARFLWGLTLVALPVTSFRFFPAGDGTYVRPLALYPLAILMVLLSIQLFRRTTMFPVAGALTPLAAFLLAGLAMSAIGIALAPVAMRGQDVAGRIVRAWAAILTGVLFFGAAVWMNRGEADVRFSLQWLFAGFVLDLIWSGLQAATFYLHVLPKPLVTHWQRAFSLRELIRTNRVSGLAYEPSWLAGQIATLYLPWLFAALLTKVRITRLKWLEPLLLIFAAVLVLATFSRGGLVTAVVAAVLTFLLVGRSEMRAGWRWFYAGFARRSGWTSRVALMTAAGALVFGAVLFLGQKGYMARIWNTRASSLENFLIQNSAGARGAYVWGALRAYEDHPWTGVGLGASGFYMYARLPDWALTTVPEIARQLSPDSSLYPNPKNLYVRLLAETGLIGLVLFMAFQFSLLGDAVSALSSGSTFMRYLAVAAIFTWVALIMYNMTQDSLATPNLWVNLGILAGAMGNAAGWKQ